MFLPDLFQTSFPRHDHCRHLRQCFLISLLNRSVTLQGWPCVQLFPVRPVLLTAAGSLQEMQPASHTPPGRTPGGSPGADWVCRHSLTVCMVKPYPLNVMVLGGGPQGRIRIRRARGGAPVSGIPALAGRELAPLSALATGGDMSWLSAAQKRILTRSRPGWHLTQTSSLRN